MLDPDLDLATMTGGFEVGSGTVESSYAATCTGQELSADFPYLG